MTTIDDVLVRMDERLDRAVTANDPRGYFGAVYRAVTARVRDGVDAGEFLDNDRMEQFDVTFATYYLDAADAYDAGRPLSASWRVAFERASSPLLVLQHVLMGMNAHINLDLGVAAADTAPGARIGELAADFDTINDVLADMVDRMQDAVASVSPWTGVLDRVSGRLDEVITNWSLEHARDRAWRFATEVAAAPDRAGLIAERDRRVAAVSERIVDPGSWSASAVAAMRRGESHDVGTIVRALRERGADLPAV